MDTKVEELMLVVAEEHYFKFRDLKVLIAPFENFEIQDFGARIKPKDFLLESFPADLMFSVDDSMEEIMPTDKE